MLPVPGFTVLPSTTAACLQYAVLPNAIFCCRPRMNVSSKAWLPHPTPNPQWGVGRGSHALLQTFILGLKKNTAFGSTAYRRHAANRHMEASRLVFPSISFDFLKKTKESASQALLPRGRGIAYVEQPQQQQ